MADEQLYCDAPECDDPEHPGHPRPVAGHGRGLCSSHMKQFQRTRKTTRIAEKLNPEERAIEAGTKMLEADDPADYSKARRAWLVACRVLGEQERIEVLSKASKRAAAAAKSRGVRLGRPPKVTTEKVLEALRTFGSTTQAAAYLGVHRDTVYAHLGRVGKGHHFPTTQSGPRKAG